MLDPAAAAAVIDQSKAHDEEGAHLLQADGVAWSRVVTLHDDNKAGLPGNCCSSRGLDMAAMPSVTTNTFSSATTASTMSMGTAGDCYSTVDPTAS